MADFIRTSINQEERRRDIGDKTPAHTINVQTLIASVVEYKWLTLNQFDINHADN